MANPLDLQEQEQLEDIKAFWKRYGNLIAWLITACLLAYAGWNGWGWYQRDQTAKAGVVFDELDKAAAAGDADKVGRIFADLKDRYGRTALAQQGGLRLRPCQGIGHEQITLRSQRYPQSMRWPPLRPLRSQFRAELSGRENLPRLEVAACMFEDLAQPQHIGCVGLGLYHARQDGQPLTTQKQGRLPVGHQLAAVVGQHETQLRLGTSQAGAMRQFKQDPLRFYTPDGLIHRTSSMGRGYLGLADLGRLR